MPKTIGEEIDDLFELREKYYAAKKIADDLYTQVQEGQNVIYEHMEENKLDKASGTKATVSLKESVIAHVKDWDKVYNFILRNKAFHLMQKRIADAAFRELVELRKGRQIPGIEPFTKKGINLRRRS